MIQISQEKIQHIPVIRINLQDQTQQDQQSVVIAYHGWTHSKDEDVLLGIELAKQGFMVIMPDAPQHGDYPHRQIPVDPMIFPEILLAAVNDVSLILDEIQTKNSDHSAIYICGISMGGIITGMCLSRYPQLNGAGILMGATHTSGFIQALIEHYQVPAELVQQAQIQEAIRQLQALDLSLHPDHLGNRPLYLWHAQNDSTVPYRFNQDLITYLESQPLVKDRKIQIDQTGGHKVPYQRMIELANFFKQVDQ